MIIYPRITIITPTYNRATLLERAIISVINQRYDNLEFIIIDGASTDGTFDLLNKYDEKISKWISEPDTGPIYAIKKGYELATGDYIYFLSSDDYLEPGILNNIGNILYREYCDVLHGDFIYYDNINAATFLCKPWFTSNNDIYINRYQWPSVFLNTFFVKKSIYDSFIKDINSLYVPAVDYEMFQMLLDRNVFFKYYDNVIVHANTGGISDNAMKGYFQVAKISINHGCGRISAINALIKKVVIRKAAIILTRIGLAHMRDKFLVKYSKNIVKLPI